MTTELERTIPHWPMPRTCPLLPPDDYAELRRQPPVQVRLDDGGTALILTRYADVREAMTNPALSADVTQPGFPLRIPVPPLPRLQSFMRMDAPEHARLRRMVMPELSPKAVGDRRPAARRLVADLLTDLADRPRPADLVATFALPLPALLIADMLGVPEADLEDFAEQTRLIVTSDASESDAMAAFGQLSAYLDMLVRDKEKNPTDDLTSQLATQYWSTGRLDHDDLVAMVRLVLVAGHETTANQLALSVLTLMRHPDAVTEMLARPDRLDGLIEELLRFWSIPQDNQVRVAVGETELGGVPVCPGQAVIFALPAANHDETVFPDPDRFDPSRDARHHLAFGHGAHYCPGAPLARMEMAEALPALFTKFPGLRLAEPYERLPFRHNTVVYGLDRLPVTW